MTIKCNSDRLRIVFIRVLLVLSLIFIGIFMRFKLDRILKNYMEYQVTSQAEIMSELIDSKISMELENLENISKYIEHSDVIENGEFFTDEDKGVTSGLLKQDGSAVYGEELNFEEFNGIQDAFRGNSSVSFSYKTGILFTTPVYSDKNIKYVLYKLYDFETMADKISFSCYNNRVDIMISDVNENVIIPFRNHSMDIFISDDAAIEAAGIIREKMNMSSIASCYYNSDKEENIMFVAEIPQYNLYLAGLVPYEAAGEGISFLPVLVIVVFGMLMLLIVIGMVYLFFTEQKARENIRIRMKEINEKHAEKVKRQFLANISHRIKTYINVVNNMNDMIIKECADKNIKKYTAVIKNAGQTATSLVNNVFDLIKIRTGELKIKEENYTFDALLYGIVNIIQKKANRKNLNFNVYADEALPNMLCGDKNRIGQIIINLLNNAVNYTREGSISLRVEQEGRKEDMQMLKFSVMDTGIGIRESDRDKLFKSFGRFDIKENRDVDGTGMSLAVTLELAKAMKGRVEVESVYRVGSTFIVYLPQKIKGEEKIGNFYEKYDDYLIQQELKKPFLAPAAKILVVDDNRTNLFVMENLLKDTEIQVTKCQNGEECLKYIVKEHYDLILMEIMMPEMDGITIMKNFKALEGNLCFETPVIAMDTGIEQDVKEMCLEAGFADFLVMPIDSNQLQDILRKYIPVSLQKITDETAEEAIYINKNESCDDKYVDEDLALQFCGGNRQFYCEILDMVCKQYPEKVKIMENYFKHEDWHNYRIEIHSLKSTSKTVGGKQLYRKVLEQETAFRNKDMDYVKNHHREVMELYNMTVAEAKTLIGK